MSDGFNFKFKIKINGFSYDYDKQIMYDNGFVKIYYASDFNELKDVFIRFINGDNRFINIKFNTDTKKLEYTKRYADETEVTNELIAGLDFDMEQISDKVFFVLTSNAKLHWWDRLGNNSNTSTSTLFDFCDAGENVEYIATIRI